MPGVSQCLLMLCVFFRSKERIRVVFEEVALEKGDLRYGMARNNPTKHV